MPAILFKSQFFFQAASTAAHILSSGVFSSFSPAIVSCGVNIANIKSNLYDILLSCSLTSPPIHFMNSPTLQASPSTPFGAWFRVAVIFSSKR
jgi:hypothetical protein